MPRPPLPHMSPARRAILDTVAEAGALRTRHLIGAISPKPAWAVLIDAGVLAAYQTEIGEVITIGHAGHALLNAEGVAADHIHAVSRAIVRACQAEASITLHRLGYEVVAVHRTDPRRDASPIQSFQVRVPHAQQLRADWRCPSTRYRQYNGPRVGEPLVYAAPTMSVERVRDLMRQHERDIATWRAPLHLYVVNMPVAVRAWKRRFNASRNQRMDAQYGVGLCHGRPRYEELLIQQLP